MRKIYFPSGKKYVVSQDRPEVIFAYPNFSYEEHVSTTLDEDGWVTFQVLFTSQFEARSLTTANFSSIKTPRVFSVDISFWIFPTEKQSFGSIFHQWRVMG